jgi:acyl carrier protein
MPDFELGKIVVCGVRPAHSKSEQIVVFLLYRQDLASFAPLVVEVRERIAAHTGLEVDAVIPVSRIPKTTSGKVQRAHLSTSYLDGEFSDVMAGLARLAANEAKAVTGGSDSLEADILAVCLEFAKERKVGLDDNLFEIGISSLTLTEIMLGVDQKFPGLVDVSDLFDYPTVREIASLIRARTESVT